jgi:hypothetical protein
VALSYCWGDPALSQTTRLNGRSVSITANLWLALDFLYDYDPLALYWIDAICINQRDISERSLQIQQMWRIFSCAETVVSWLGPPDDSTALAYACFEESDRWLEETMKTLVASYGDREGAYQRHSTMESLVEKRPFRPSALSLSSVFALLSRDYFSRTWIMPEILQAQRIWVCCGTYSTCWTAIERYLMQIRVSAQDELNTWSAQEATDGTLSDLPARRLFGARTAGLIQPRDFDYAYAAALFVHLLFSFSLCGCADVRGRIFAMLGTPRIRSLGSWITLQADYAMTVGDLAVAVMTEYCSLKNRETKGGVVEVDHGLQFDSCLRLLLIGLGGSNCQHHLQRWIEQQIDGLWLDARGRLKIKLRALENNLNVGPVLQHMLTRDRVSDTAHRTRALRSCGGKTSLEESNKRKEDGEDDDSTNWHKLRAYQACEHPHRRECFQSNSAHRHLKPPLRIERPAYHVLVVVRRSYGVWVIISPKPSTTSNVTGSRSHRTLVLTGRSPSE